MIHRLHAAISILLLALLPALAAAQPLATPDDPGYAEQWALRQIGAPCAWGVTTGSSAVTVAVVDSGVDLGHPDLVGRLRADGHDFVDGDDEPRDENGHGTNVAGVIAATLNNAEGGTGLAPGITLLPVRVMNRRGKGTDSNIAAGVRYAADKGAQVINLSLGATLTIAADSESAEVGAAIRYAQRRGALVVAAAGNDFLPQPNAIVDSNPDVLVVAATDDRDRLAPFSNYGSWIAVTAPGVHIYSTAPTYPVYLTSDELPPDERLESTYSSMSGTSQATPFVSALAALLFSAHPDWEAAQVAAAIRSSAADLSRRNPRLVAEGQLGSGRIDACAALAPSAAAPDGRPQVVAPAAPSSAPAPSARPQMVAPTSAPAPSVLPQVIAPAPTPTPAPAAQAAGGWRIGGGLLLCLALPLLLFGLLLRRPAARRYKPSGAAGWGALVVLSGAVPGRFVLNGSAISIGRAPECAIVLAGDGAVSRRHALIRNGGGRVTVEDAGSTHGTYLNSQRVTAAVAVRRGDLLQVGQTQLRFE